MLESGASPDCSLEDGYTILMDASRIGDLEMVKLILEHGADVNRERKRARLGGMVNDMPVGHNEPSNRSLFIANVERTATLRQTTSPRPQQP